MHAKSFIILAGIAAFASAQDVDENDLPMQCREVCNSIVSLTAQCDRDNNDSAQLSCICNAQGISTQLPLCDACMSQYNTADNPPSDNDVHDLLTSCSFSSLSTFTGPTGTSTINQTSASLTSSVSTTITDSSTTRTTQAIVVTATSANASGSSAMSGSSTGAATASAAAALPTGQAELGAVMAAVGLVAAFM